MPIYEYRCPDHGVEEQIRPYSDSELVEVPCTKCGKKSERLVETPFMQPDNYWMGKHSVSLGKTFNSRSEMKHHCKLRGIEEGGGLTDYTAASRRAGAERDRAARHKAVREKAIASTVRDMVI